MIYYIIFFTIFIYGLFKIYKRYSTAVIHTNNFAEISDNKLFKILVDIDNDRYSCAETMRQEIVNELMNRYPEPDKYEILPSYPQMIAHGLHRKYWTG